MIALLTLALLLLASTAALLAAADGALLAAGTAAPTQIIRDPERAHRALGLSRVLAHLATGTVAALAAWTVTDRPGVATAVTLGVVLVVVCLVEGAARFAGSVSGMAAVTRLARLVGAVDAVFLPATALGVTVERALSRVLPPADAGTVRREEDAEQFREVVAAEAQVSQRDEQLLQGVFSLGETQVREIMIPRVDVVGIERNTPWSEVLDRVSSSKHARFPVFDDTLDNILGILYAKDLLPSVVRDEEPDDWTRLIRPATFIPSSKAVDHQLRDFKAQQTHIALIMDEFGGLAGVITIEDILEVIVGEIHDEYDVEEPEVHQEGDDRFWIAGHVSLSELSELLDADMEREGLTTVGGLVYEAFEGVPAAGQSTSIGGFHVIVERVRRRRVERVYFERRRATTETA